MRRTRLHWVIKTIYDSLLKTSCPQAFAGCINKFRLDIWKPVVLPQNKLDTAFLLLMPADEQPTSILQEVRRILVNPFLPCSSIRSLNNIIPAKPTEGTETVVLGKKSPPSILLRRSILLVLPETPTTSFLIVAQNIAQVKFLGRLLGA